MSPICGTVTGCLEQGNKKIGGLAARLLPNAAVGEASDLAFFHFSVRPNIGGDGGRSFNGNIEGPVC